jgi:hypothetical protein
MAGLAARGKRPGQAATGREDVVLRSRHCDWYERLAGQADVEWFGPRQAYWIACLSREFADMGAVVEFCLTEPGEAEAAIRVMASLPRGFWWSSCPPGRDGGGPATAPAAPDRGDRRTYR